MILSYLKRNNIIKPELQKKAEDLISTGYQALITYEVPGGGFSWFGKRPADITLTAYGLLEFSDMRRVYEIDDRLIERTQRWLISKQNKDGSFGDCSPRYETPRYSSLGIGDDGEDSPGYETPIYIGDHGEGSSRDDSTQGNTCSDSGSPNLLDTAYITWALMESGCRDDAVMKGTACLKAHLPEIRDSYIMALTANCFALADRSSRDTDEICRRLLSKVKLNKDKAYWECGGTAMSGYGEAGRIENTALAAQALLRSGSAHETAQKALNYLISTRSPSGTWSSTQATVLALRALIEADSRPKKQSGKIDISINGKAHSSFDITEEMSDVIQMADLREAVRKGVNTIELGKSGTGIFTYQVTGKYFIPWKGERESVDKPLTISVAYDRTTLSTNDQIKVEAAIERSGASSRGMVIAELGVPPGFTVMTEDLERLRESGVIERYELTSTQIIFYLLGMERGSRVSLPYRIKARFPIRAKSPSSTVYEYYNPENRAESPPLQITVR